VGECHLCLSILELELGGTIERWNFGDQLFTLQSRLSNWKGRLLSIARRICLTKSVITALLLFYMSFFKVPKLVCKIIKLIQINFLWGWGSEGKKIPWVAWNKICALVEAGGSSIRDIDIFNIALLAKWKWRLGSEEVGDCKNVIES